jgi:hypothetical protein
MNMRYILDTNCLIYLVKAGLAGLCYSLTGRNLVIDSDVYNEAVSKGKWIGSLDAMEIEDFLKDNNVPIIPTNIEKEITVFRDPSEASCSVLCKAGGTCITGDIVAIKKFMKENQQAIRVEFYFFQKWLDNDVLTDDMKEILRKLEAVNAITHQRREFVLEQMGKTKRA